MLFKILSVHIFKFLTQISLLPYKSQKILNSYQQEHIFFIKGSGIFFAVKNC